MMAKPGGGRALCQVGRIAWICLLCIIHGNIVASQECPLDWESFGQSCYRFVFHPVKSFDEAKTACQMHSSALVSVDFPGEHGFISQWLTRTDTRKNNWYTSGEEDSLNPGDFWWSGTGKAVDKLAMPWISQSELEGKGRAVVYKFNGVVYGWGRAKPANEFPYICEIARSESHRIFQSRRNFFFGTDVEDINQLEKGPHFIEEPKDKIIIGSPDRTYVECVATGNPQPVYTWRKLTGSQYTPIPTNTGRYAVTNGRFNIAFPKEETEAGEYQCVAENKFGTVLSSPVQLSFGYLRQFINVQRDAVRVLAFQGAAIECGSPESKPGLVYQWYKDSARNFLRPSLQKYLFISYNGKLYFSEATRVDQGNYYCVVQLRTTENTEIRQQAAPSGTSLPIPLEVTASPPLEWGPQIQDDFVAVFPKSPLRGQRVRLECFAYGTDPLFYSWSRIDGYLPSKAQLEDHNRVLIIPDAQLEDSGQYNCHVSRRQSATDDQAVDLKIVAVPYFTLPLGNQHADKGSQLTWRCEAKAVPEPAYTWYKNGEKIQSIPGQLEVNRNVLVIKALDPLQHSGMYQCSASNIYGTVYSSGQLRVMTFKPSFRRNPLQANTEAAINGNVTIRCRPEASPYPDFKWAKNGGELGLIAGSETGRVRLDISGDLLITGVQPGDAGRYTCTATNTEGSASSFSQLRVAEGTRIFRSPDSTSTVVNSTAFLYCQASHSRDLDLVYMWFFNGRRIDLKNNPYFGAGNAENPGGIYIRNAQLIHMGEYECLAQTPLDKATARAFLTVEGPPPEMAGVYVDRLSITSYSMRVKWTVTGDNDLPITAFIIEALTKYNTSWQLVAKDISFGETLNENDDKSSFVVYGLKPNVGYSFRVLAVNNIGISAPSQPSDEYYTPGAPPNVAPQMVGGGGGSVGLLTMTWEPLPPIDAHGAEIGYVVYWRRPGPSLTWDKATVFGNVGKYVTHVGLDNFYLEYELKVQARNEYGSGPNSSVEIIFSAEGIPVGMLAGFDLSSVNGTAMDVSWDPLEETRESIKGKVLGYWINYWIEPSLNDMDEDSEIIMQYKPVYGQVGETTVIGLEPGTYYMFTIQVFNSAGLGPISEDEFDETDGLAPLRYPMEVHVYSHSSDTVYVTFRGITTSIDEEPLRGYMLRYWVYGNTIESAIDVDLEMETSGYISGLEKNKMYEMRALGYSAGGFGKQSPTTLFTLGGQVVLDSTVTELLAAGTMWKANMWLTVFSLLCVYVLKHIFHDR
ncbi:contactin-like isoform X2 [Liolophura sinensis]